MAVCANCTQEALYTYPVSAGYNLHYCQYHLPKFLTSRRDAGLLPIIEDAPAPKAKKSAAVTPEEPSALN